MVDEVGIETGIRRKPETVGSKKPEIKIYGSLEEALGERDFRDISLYEDFTNNVLVKDSPCSSVEHPDFSRPLTPKNYEAYAAVSKYFWEGEWEEGRPKQGTHFKLFRHDFRLYTALEHELGDNLSVLQILDAERVNTEETREGYFEWIKAIHVLLINKESGKVFDVVRLLPSNFVFQCVPSSVEVGLSQYGKYSAKRPKDNFIRYNDPTDPEKILSLLHEVGHIMRADDEPRLARELMSIQETSFSLTKEQYMRLKQLKVASERGASARALWLMRKLKGEGIDLGLEPKEAREAINRWLTAYEEREGSGLPKEGRHFTRRK